MSKLFQCKGKHFKVYNNILGQVLEHPAEDRSVNITFSHLEDNVQITITDFITSRMRIAGQKNRADIYILQEEFKPFLEILEQLIEKVGMESQARARTWRYGSPFSRNGRQGVPRLKKLAELWGIHFLAPFPKRLFEFKEACLVVDSEIPGRDQSKWDSEGGSRQIHFGIFGGEISNKNGEMPEVVIVNIPLNELNNNFINPIKLNWID